MATRKANGRGWGVPPNKGETYAPEVLTREEVRALLAACGRSATGLRNRGLLVVLWRGGLRVGEALALRPSDLDPAAGTVRIPRGKTGHRTVGLDPEALALVGQWATHRRAILGLGAAGRSSARFGAQHSIGTIEARLELPASRRRQTAPRAAPPPGRCLRPPPPPFVSD